MALFDQIIRCGYCDWLHNVRVAARDIYIGALPNCFNPYAYYKEELLDANISLSSASFNTFLLTYAIYAFNRIKGIIKKNIDDFKKKGFFISLSIVLLIMAFFIGVDVYFVKNNLDEKIEEIAEIVIEDREFSD